jgi:hypothetical protein
MSKTTHNAEVREKELVTEELDCVAGGWPKSSEDLPGVPVKNDCWGPFAAVCAVAPYL